MTRRALPFLLLLSLPALGGCPDSGSGPDARIRDDGMNIDAAAVVDAPPGAVDAGAIDAAPGAIDAAPPADAAPVLFNNCDPLTAEDHTGVANVAVTWTFTPTPRCFKVSVGTQVTFTVSGGGDFSFHPLIGGSASGTPPVKVPDPTSPITPTMTGTTVSFTMANAGMFGFYCNIHTTTMRGVVYVE